jgi:hypothetical protein
MSERRLRIRLLLVAFTLGVMLSVFGFLSWLLYGRCVCQKAGVMSFEAVLSVAQWGVMALGAWVVVLALVMLFERR